MDIYSFGELCYELFTETRPYNKVGDGAALAKAKTREPVPDPRLGASDLSESVVSIIMMAMSIDPADRYEAMNYLRDDLAVELADRLD